MKFVVLPHLNAEGVSPLEQRRNIIPVEMQGLFPHWADDGQFRPSESTFLLFFLYTRFPIISLEYSPITVKQLDVCVH
jgi:hypothetical protein